MPDAHQQLDPGLLNADTEEQILNKLVEPGMEADTSKKKRFVDGNEFETRIIDSEFKNLANRNISTTNISVRKASALLMLATVARSKQAIREEHGPELILLESQHFSVDIYNTFAALNKSTPAAGGTLLHLARSKIAISHDTKREEPKIEEKKGWNFLGGNKSAQNPQ